MLDIAFRAVKSGNIEKLRECIERDAGVLDHVHEEHGFKLLSFAVRELKSERVADVIAVIGEKINIANSGLHGFTALHDAVEGVNIFAVRALMRYKELINFQEYDEGMTPLMLGASSADDGAYHIVCELLKSEDIDLSCTDKNGYTACDHAQYSGSECVKRLLEKTFRLKILSGFEVPSVVYPEDCQALVVKKAISNPQQDQLVPECGSDDPIFPNASSS